MTKANIEAGNIVTYFQLMNGVSTKEAIKISLMFVRKQIKKNKDVSFNLAIKRELKFKLKMQNKLKTSLSQIK